MNILLRKEHTYSPSIAENVTIERKQEATKCQKKTRCTPANKEVDIHASANRQTKGVIMDCLKTRIYMYERIIPEKKKKKKIRKEKKEGKEQNSLEKRARRYADKQT